jgi:hypothetical protein
MLEARRNAEAQAIKERVENEVMGEDRLAFTMAGEYPDGKREFCHRARAPGTEMALGRSSTLGRSKTLRASSSTTSRSGFCSSWVCGLVGVVLGRGPLLSGKTLSFISYLQLLRFRQRRG